MNDPTDHDIVSFLNKSTRWTGDELDLDELAAGDQLLVRTKNTCYLLKMTGPHLAEMSTDRADRPSGTVQIQGCVFGQSTIIKPNHLFCGGGVEIMRADGSRTFTTSPIREINVLRVDRTSGARSD